MLVLEIGFAPSENAYTLEKRHTDASLFLVLKNFKDIFTLSIQIAVPINPKNCRECLLGNYPKYCFKPDDKWWSANRSKKHCIDISISDTTYEKLIIASCLSENISPPLKIITIDASLDFCFNNYIRCHFLISIETADIWEDRCILFKNYLGKNIHYKTKRCTICKELTIL